MASFSCEIPFFNLNSFNRINTYTFEISMPKWYYSIYPVLVYKKIHNVALNAFVKNFFEIKH